MPKGASGALSRLLAEKNRFTIETQGLSYPTKQQLLAVREDAAWTDDESSDGEDGRRQRSPPVAQKVASEVSRLLQGGAGGLSEALLENALVESLGTDPTAAGYDVAKDYLKQVLGQLYGGEPLDQSTHATASDDAGLPNSASVTGPKHLVPKPPQTGPDIYGYVHAQQNAPTATSSAAAAPPQQPAADSAATAARGQLAAHGSGAAAAAAAAAAFARADSHPEEQPRVLPRPHHGRIKEQLDLLQNADQLAAIISVATTAATTAAAAAVKQTMQTPTPPLPPGAYARMLAAARSGGAGNVPWGGSTSQGGDMGLPPSLRLAMGMMGLPAAGEGGAGAGGSEGGAVAHGEGGEGDSPDPQPQLRTAPAPHQRATPMQRQGADSSMRVVQLGAPKVTARTPPPGSRPVPPALAAARKDGADREGAGPGAEDGTARNISFGGWAEGEHSSKAGKGEAVDHPGSPGLDVRNERDAGVGSRAAAPGAPRGRGLHYVSTHAAGAAEAAQASAVQLQRAARALAEAGDKAAAAAASGARVAAEADYQQGPPAQGLREGQQQDGQQMERGTTAQLAEELPAEGLFVAGGPSVFGAHAGAGALAGVRNDTGAAAAAQHRPQLPLRPRPELPPDVAAAFRSTLAFIADPDTALQHTVQQQPRQPPAWLALADVEAREQAEKEAQELLGGAFDYAAAKRELDRAKRYSRLMAHTHVQAHVSPTPAPGTAAGGPVGRASVGGRGAGAAAIKGGAAGRGPRPGGVPIGATGVAAGAAGLGVGAAPAVVRGDFAGVLPPPHTVWDVDEAWYDLDEFSRVVGQEVAYRAAASAGTGKGAAGAGAAGLRAGGSPGRGAGTAAGGAAGATGGVTAVAVRGGKPAAEQAAASAAVATSGPSKPKGRPSSPSRGRTGSPVRARSPSASPASPPRVAGLATAASAAAAATVRARQAAAGPVRVAFGRRVEEPPKKASKPAGRRRSSSSSPPRPGRSASPQRRRRAAAGAAVDGLSAGSVGTEAMRDVLEVLASVLLSEGGSEHGEDAVGAQDEVPAARAVAQVRPVLEDAPAGPAAPRQARDVPTAGAGVDEANRTEHAEPKGQTAAADAAAGSGQAVMEAAAGPAGSGPGATTAPPHRQALLTAAGPPDAAPWAAEGPGAAAAMLHSSLRQATQATGSPRRQFTYVMDTGYPPLPRLPTWAASARATGAAAAYAAAVSQATGTATAAGVAGTPTPPQQQGAGPYGAAATLTQRLAAAAADAAAAAQGYASPGRAPSGLAAAATNILPADAQQQQLAMQQLVLRQQQQQLQLLAGRAPYMQLTAFPVPSDPLTTTHVLPSDGAAAAVAAAAAAARTPAPASTRKGKRGKGVGGSGAEAAPEEPTATLETALMQLVEDEVVGRLATAQLAAQRVPPVMVPQDQPGSLSPLVDYELARSLVTSVLRDNLKVLLEQQQQAQRQTGYSSAYGNTVYGNVHGFELTAAEAQPPLTLEEVVAALAAQPVVLPARQPAQQQQQQDLEQSAGQVGLDGIQGGVAADGTGEQPARHDGEDHGQGPEVLDTSADGYEAAESSAKPAQPLTTGTPEGVQAADGTEQLQQEQEEGAHAEGSLSAASAGSGPGSAAGSGSSVQGQAQGTMPPAATQRREPSAADLQVISSGQSGWGGVLNQALQGAASGLGRALRAGAAKAVEVATRLDPSGMQTDQEQSPPPPPPPQQQQQQPAQVLDYARQPPPPPRQQQHEVHSGRELAVQAAGVQARSTDAFGVQTRGVQAAGVAVVGTQAVGIMERGTQAAGVRDTAAQADPPPPHYLLQAAMAAGMSAYSLAPPALPAAPAAPTTAPGVPYFLVPADGSATAPAAYLPSYAARGLYGGLGLAGGREGRKVPLNLPGLSKMRDSSELDTSTDSLHPPRRIKGPGARAREARAVLGSYGSDDDDNDSDLMQRSYPRLELSSLTARPVRLMDRAALEQEEQEDARNPLERLPFDRLGLGPPVPSVPGATVSRRGSSRSGQQGHGLWEETQEELVTELAEVAHGSDGSGGSAADSRRTVGVQGGGSDDGGRGMVQPEVAEAASGPGPGWGAASAAGSARSGASGAPSASGASAVGSLASVHSGSGSQGGLMLAAGAGASHGRHPDQELEELLSMPSGGSGLGTDRVPMQAASSRAGSGVAAGAASGHGSAAASLAASQAFGSAADGDSDVAGQGSSRPSGGAASDRGSHGGSVAGAATPGADVRRDQVGSGEGAVGQAVPWTPATPPAVADDQLVEEEGTEDGGAVDEVEQVEFEDEDGLGLLQAAEYSDDMASEEQGGEQQQDEAGRGDTLEGQAAGAKSAAQEVAGGGLGLQHAGQSEQQQADARVDGEGTGAPESAGSSARGSGGGSASGGGLGGMEARSVSSAAGQGSARSAASAVDDGGIVEGEGQGEQEVGAELVEGVRRYGSGGDEEDEHGRELEGDVEMEGGEEVEVEEEQLLDEVEVGQLLDKEDEVADHAEDEGLGAVEGREEEPEERRSAEEEGGAGSKGDGGAFASLGGSSRGSHGKQGGAQPAGDSAKGGSSSSSSSNSSISSSSSSSGGSGKGSGSAAASGAPSRTGSVKGPGLGALPRPVPESADAADPEDGVVEAVHDESSAVQVGEDGESNPTGAWGRQGHEGDGAEEDKLRSSLDRMARVGLAALELPRRSGQGSLRGAVAAVVTTTAPPAAAATAGRTLTGGAAAAGPDGRQAAPPLTHMRTVSFGGVTTQEAAPLMEAPEAPPSPGQPPRLDKYRGPTGRLWRPPGLGGSDPHDPLLSSSSETLMADSEASEPPLDPLSATLRTREQRQDMLRAQAVVEQVLPYGGLLVPMQTYSDVRTRRTERPMGRAPAYEGIDSLRDSDGRVVDVDLDVSSSSDSSTVGPSGTASASSARAAAALAAARAGGVAAGRGRGAGASLGMASGGNNTDEEDEGDEDRLERGARGAGGRGRAAQASAAAAARLAGGRREAAVFRLRQYSMRRRKLMQQIGVRDPLLSSATSLSTDTSSRPGDTEGDPTYTLDVAGSDRELGLGDDDDDMDDGGSSVMAGDVFSPPPVPMAPLPSFGVGAGRLGSRLARPL